MRKLLALGIALALAGVLAAATPAARKDAGNDQETTEETGKKKRSLWNFLRVRTNGGAEEDAGKKKKRADEPRPEPPTPPAQVDEARPDEPVPTAEVEVDPRLEEKAARRAERDEERLERAAGTSQSPRALAAAQARLKASPVAADPLGRAYLDFVDRGAASAAHLNEFSIFLAERGMLSDALAYQKEALRLEDDDPELWINLGTLHREVGDLSAAMAAFKRAIAIDPNHAVAHYNLGVAYDERRDYDRAVEEYRLALTLDPALADPLENPQIVNNDRLLAVKLLLYQQQAGALGLPLISKPEGRPVGE